MKSYVTNGLLIVISLVFGAVLIEGYLRIAQPYWLSGKFLLTPNLDVAFNTREFDSRVVTNDIGLREGRTITSTHDGQYRIAAIGDSFTFGWGVNNDQTYPAVLESLLNEQQDQQIQVVNMGRPGDNPAAYLRTFNLHGQRLRPDMVVAGFMPANDCPIGDPVSPDTDAALDRRVASLVDEASRPWKKINLHIGRLVTTRITKPLRAWVRSSGAAHEGIVRDPMDNSGNPLDPIILLPRLKNDAVRLARYQALKDAGWVAQGERWEISPWLVLFAIYHPDYPARALFLNAETNAQMERQFRVCEGVVKAMADKVRATGAKFVLAVLPSPAQVSPAYLRSRRELGIDIPAAALTDRTVNDRLMAFCRRENLICIDTLDDMRGQAAKGTPLYFPIDGHATAAGYQWMARTLAPTLLKKIQAP